MLEFVANLMEVSVDAGDWAHQREAEGWPVLAASDHFWSGDRAFPHLWVTLTHMACRTSTATLTSSFANNLLRSPVEFAQASLLLQRVSGGRFEAGLGAGWSEAEITGSGLRYPPPAERAGRLREAVTIVRELLVNGHCRFAGEYYDVDVPVIGPFGGPVLRPPLVASLGGPRTIREVAPLVDRVEIKPNSPATRDGRLDFRALAAIPHQHLLDLIDAVRKVRPDVPLGLFVLCSTGTDDRTRSLESMMGDGLFSGFFGSAGKVAESIRGLEALGISRVQISPLSGDSFDELAPLLLAP